MSFYVAVCMGRSLPALQVSQTVGVAGFIDVDHTAFGGINLDLRDQHYLQPDFGQILTFCALVS